MLLEPGLCLGKRMLTHASVSTQAFVLFVMGGE
jgi:hypothetical protein